MNELKLLCTAFAATFILQFVTALLSAFRNKKNEKPTLSKKILNAFGIEHYTLCEKALCQLVPATVALLFIAAYEIATFERNANSSIFTAIVFGIGGILLMKLVFSTWLKISGHKGFYRPLFYSHVTVFAAIAVKAYQYCS